MHSGFLGGLLDLLETVREEGVILHSITVIKCSIFKKQGSLSITVQVRTTCCQLHFIIASTNAGWLEDKQDRLVLKECLVWGHGQALQ